MKDQSEWSCIICPLSRFATVPNKLNICAPPPSSPDYEVVLHIYGDYKGAKKNTLTQRNPDQAYTSPGHASSCNCTLHIRLAPGRTHYTLNTTHTPGAYGSKKSRVDSRAI